MKTAVGELDSPTLLFGCFSRPCQELRSSKQRTALAFARLQVSLRSLTEACPCPETAHPARCYSR